MKERVPILIIQYKALVDTVECGFRRSWSHAALFVAHVRYAGLEHSRSPK